MAGSSYKSYVGKEDMKLKESGTSQKTFNRETSTGGVVALTQLDAKHIQFQSVAKQIEDLVDAGYDVVITPQEVKISGGLRILSGSGSPEGAVTAPVGSIYLRTDGGAGTTVYVKESGTGDTGWQPYTATASSLPLAGGTLTGAVIWNESGDEYLRVPRLTTTQRDLLSASNGMLIYNTTTGQFQVYEAGAWLTLATLTGTETLTYKTLTTPTIGDFSNANHDHSSAAQGGSLSTGKVVQVVHASTGAVATGTTVMPKDDTIPQNTEGDQYGTVEITPTDATNKLLIEVILFASTNLAVAHHITAALFQDATADALAVACHGQDTTGQLMCIAFKYYMTAGTTSATTFKLRAGPNVAATVTVNGSGGSRLFGGKFVTSMTVTEIAT